MAGSEITKALLCRCFIVDWAVLSAVCVLPGLRAVGNWTASFHYNKTHKSLQGPAFLDGSKSLEPFTGLTFHIILQNNNPFATVSFDPDHLELGIKPK